MLKKAILVSIRIKYLSLKLYNLQNLNGSVENVKTHT